MKKMMMFAIVCAIALAVSAPSALAVSLTTGSTQYLGLIDDGIPSSPSLEASYINNLIGITPGLTPTTQTIGTETYTRSINPCPVGGCPTPTAVGSFKLDRDEGPDAVNPVIHLGIDVTGWTYLLAKYDGPRYGSAVWYVGGMTGTVDIPENLPFANQYQISHYSLYNPTSVPEGGMTLMLLGGALLGLETLRRRIRA